MKAPLRIRVVLADDHKIVREGLRRLLEMEPAMEIVGEADDGRVAVEMSSRLLPDIVIMDLSMPNLNGVEATRQIRAGNPEVQVIALSMHSDPSYVARMLKAGASGYLLKDCASVELVGAIRKVISNHLYLSPAISEIVTKDYVRQLTEAEVMTVGKLSDRESEVLQLVAEGNSTKEIASALYISVKTVETHRRQIMQKLNVKSIAGLVKYAVREGLTSLDK